MIHLTPDWIGWIATAIFLASYFSKDQRKLRQIQALAAVLWVAYGAILHAIPIVVANLLVAGAALYSSLAGSAARLSRASAPDLSRIS
jgi:predicted acyltransferase